MTSLSSSLVGKFGDSYGIALIGISNDEYLQWESVDSTGAATSLPDIPDPFSNPTEVQYDNRYGLFHFERDFNYSFPTSVVILLPTEKIRFRVLQEQAVESSINLELCKKESLLFVFFKIDSTVSTILNYLQEYKDKIISLTNCKTWPFSNLVFRICPDLREVSTQSSTKTAASEFK